MSLEAILFGSIGTLVETSRLQQESFNAAFQEAGLDWTWDKDEYREMLKKPGGKRRIEDYAASRGETVDASAIHKSKTNLFNRRMREEGLALRPGVMEVIEWAKTRNIKLGFVTTTERASTISILKAAKELSPDTFDFVGDRSLVENSKPSPEIYERALKNLAVDADNCIAIEDTVACLASPLAAGITTIAFPNEYAEQTGYDGARARVDELKVDLFVGR